MGKKQKRMIEGDIWTHSGGIPRTKTKARDLAKELRSGGLKARVLPCTRKKGKFEVYVRKRRK